MKYFVLFFLICFSVQAKDSSELKPKKINEEVWKRIVEQHNFLLSKNKEISLEFKLIDKFGLGVADVIVYIQLVLNNPSLSEKMKGTKYYQKIKELKFITNIDGVFKVSKEVGTSIRIIKIEKDDFIIESPKRDLFFLQKDIHKKKVYVIKIIKESN
jgi:hypothetical protein